MTEEEALQRWPDLDPKERARRKKLSERASAKHEQIVDPETGRRAFGGPQPNSGRPRKPTIAEQVVSLAEGTKNKQVLSALFSGLDPKKNTPAQRVRTAEKIVKISQKQRELESREHDFSDDPREALIAFIAPALARAIKSGKLSELAAILDGKDTDTDKPADVEGTVVEAARLAP